MHVTCMDGARTAQFVPMGFIPPFDAGAAKFFTEHLTYKNRNYYCEFFYREFLS